MKNLSILVLAFIFGSVGYASYIIPNGAVTNAKLANQAVTQAKLAVRSTGSTVSAGGVAISSAATSSQNFNSAVATTITGLTVTITTLGGPVQIGLMSGVLGGRIKCGSNDGGAICFIGLYRDATGVSSNRFEMDTGVSAHTFAVAPGLITFVDTPTAGTYTYTLKGSVNDANSFLTTDDLKVFAYEL